MHYESQSTGGSGRTTTDFRARLVAVPRADCGPLPDRLLGLWYHAAECIRRTDADHPNYQPSDDANARRREALELIAALAAESSPADLQRLGLGDSVADDVRRLLREMRESVEHGASMGWPLPSERDVLAVSERVRDSFSREQESPSTLGDLRPTRAVDVPALTARELDVLRELSALAPAETKSADWIADRLGCDSGSLRRSKTGPLQRLLALGLIEKGAKRRGWRIVPARRSEVESVLGK